MIFPRPDGLAVLGHVEQGVVHLEVEEHGGAEDVTESDRGCGAGLDDKRTLGFGWHAGAE